uniref:Glycosyltransferase family 92 protein n=1 Tax=Panagrellus redivivus TaxID=6233 RepID=A0A7E4VG30_PANRE
MLCALENNQFAKIILFVFIFSVTVKYYVTQLLVNTTILGSSKNVIPSVEVNTTEVVQNVTDLIAVKKPFFVIKTYYYQNSKSFNESDAVVTLINAERHAYETLTFQCIRTLESGSVETSIGSVLDLDVTPFMCKLVLYRLVCLFPPSDEDINKFYVGVGSARGEMEYGELTVTKPNKKPYKFVSCMSRMVAVDDWAVIIFALETFRLFGGELAVAPVECAITEVMDLLRLYEKDGILKVQPGFKPRALTGLGYDPLKETEYANQMSNSHECLYDFKDTAEFISFPDWDDIIIVQNRGPKLMTYYDTFGPFIQSHPNAAAFSVARVDISVQTPLKSNDKTFSFENYLQETNYGPAYVDPKLVIRPSLIAGNWIHESKVKESKEYNQVKVNSFVATYAHLHYTLTTSNTSKFVPSYSNWHINASDFVDSETMDANFQKMLIRHSFYFVSFLLNQI